MIENIRLCWWPWVPPAEQNEAASARKRIQGISPAKLMKVVAQTDLCSYLSDAASCTKKSMTNSIHMGRVQIRCFHIFARAMPFYQACGYSKVWCHIHAIKALNEVKFARKLCASTWFDKNNSLKQTYFPALLSEAGTKHQKSPVTTISEFRVSDWLLRNDHF